ncbi:MAG: bifunctional adenosylcobinamide kinase/adenosylcobinamide-phosphate guanylyltransferase [Cyanobacteria bacterium J06621_8]
MAARESSVNEISSEKKVILILGPSSSGKSELAEILAAKSCQSVIYLATAQADEKDAEWQAKILKHQQRRPANWQTLNASGEFSVLLDQASASECWLIDSLGTWVANFLELKQSEWQQTCDRLLASLAHTQAKVILVGEETGWGVVPPYHSGRVFRDRLGDLSRQVGNLADVTYLVVGGHVVNLSLLGEPLSEYER